MRIVLAVLALFISTAAFAQEPIPAPVSAPSMLTAVQQMLGNHLGFGVVGSYDWTPGDWDRPYSVGPVASWVVSEGLVITGGAKYILNSAEKERWRSSVEVMVPLYGAGRMR